MYYRSFRLCVRKEAPGAKGQPAREDVSTATARSKPAELGDEAPVDETKSDLDGAKARWGETYAIT